MKRCISTALILFMFLTFGQATFGQTSGVEKSLSWWLKSIAYKLKAISKESKESVTAVVGVKGAENEDTDDLYWKEVELSESEFKRFKEAEGYAQEGKTDEAIKTLEAFIKDYPTSPLIKDAEEGVEILKAQKNN